MTTTKNKNRKKRTKLMGMVVHSNTVTKVAWPGELLQGQGQPGLQNEVQGNLSYNV